MSPFIRHFNIFLIDLFLACPTLKPEQMRGESGGLSNKSVAILKKFPFHEFCFRYKII